MRHALPPVALALLLCSAARADDSKPAPPPPPSTESALVSHHHAAKFAPVTTPGIPPGAESALIGVDPVTKGGTAWVQFAAGMTVPMHWHSFAEYSVVISGKARLVLDGTSHVMGPGSYAVIPANAHHELTCEKESPCLLLTRRAGPADYTFEKK